MFRLAREDGRIKYHVFIAAAYMEYFSAKDKNLAIKIFDLGLKRFGDKAEFVRIYMEFMSNMNDDNNTRFVDNYQPFWLDTIDFLMGTFLGNFRR